MTNYIVFIDKPAYPAKTGFRLDALRMLKGETWEDVRDALPPTVVAYGDGHGSTKAEALAHAAYQGTLTADAWKLCPECRPAA